ncbi:hypothetical protein EEL48_13655 [Muribaculaceae bacterium Isolate-102 (HZI)]|nr:hypothetical protein EEL48_13655 [Muribaculaceae bacterium Isolate-102 (HZI)]
MQNLSARYRELESNNRHIIDNLKREKDTLLAQMEAMLRLLGEKLEKAVRALIQFARVLAYKTFTREHKEAIVSWLALDRDDSKSNAHFVKVFARPFLTDKEFDKGCKELDRLTSFFPSVIEELEQPQRRGMKR